MIFHPCVGTLLYWGDCFEFGHAGLHRRRNHPRQMFRVFGVLTPPVLSLFLGLAGRPYNSVGTTMLHCDTYRLRSSLITSMCMNLTAGGRRPLKQASIPLVPMQVCRRRDWLGAEFTLTDRMMCAGYEHGGVDTCQA